MMSLRDLPARDSRWSEHSLPGCSPNRTPSLLHPQICNMHTVQDMKSIRLLPRFHTLTTSTLPFPLFCLYLLQCDHCTFQSGQVPRETDLRGAWYPNQIPASRNPKCVYCPVMTAVIPMAPLGPHYSCMSGCK